MPDVIAREWWAGPYGIGQLIYTFGQKRIQVWHKHPQAQYPEVIPIEFCPYKAESAQKVIDAIMLVLADVPETAQPKQVEHAVLGVAMRFGKLDLDTGRVRVDHEGEPYWRTHADRGALDENFQEDKTRTKEVADNVGPVLGDEEVA